jgi:hypothetical protein
VSSSDPERQLDRIAGAGWHRAERHRDGKATCGHELEDVVLAPQRLVVGHGSEDA